MTAAEALVGGWALLAVLIGIVSLLVRRGRR